MELNPPDEVATQRIGAALAGAMPDLRRHALLLALRGDLGTGKTTLARGLLRALGVEGPIRSPSFTLVEPYETAAGTVHHLDLYRLPDAAGELETLGFRDYRSVPGLVIVEWPEHAATALGTPDLRVELQHQPIGRRLLISAVTALGQAWLGALRY